MTGTVHAQREFAPFLAAPAGRRRWLALAAAANLFACGGSGAEPTARDGGPRPAPERDGGVPTDAGVADGGVVPDAGVMNACLAGPYGAREGDVVQDVTLPDCDGRPHAIHDLCRREAAWLYMLAAW
ncbi:MAG: hypothetical protein RIT81_07775 [Deltaproteobacteria bacterium]